MPTPRRGRAQLPVLRITSNAPFGLFRTWTWINLDATVLVYPRPADHLPVPEAPGHDTGSAQVEHGQDELAWLRDFRDGDSPRQIAWKAYARGAPLLVREYRGAAARRREFDFDALSGLDVEARLSQLTRWIVDAAARNESWVLRLPGHEPLEGSGAEHRDHCLARLALYGAAGADAHEHRAGTPADAAAARGFRRRLPAARRSRTALVYRGGGGDTAVALAALPRSHRAAQPLPAGRASRCCCCSPCWLPSAR